MLFTKFKYPLPVYCKSSWQQSRLAIFLPHRTVKQLLNPSPAGQSTFFLSQLRNTFSPAVTLPLTIWETASEDLLGTTHLCLYLGDLSTKRDTSKKIIPKPYRGRYFTIILFEAPAYLRCYGNEWEEAKMCVGNFRWWNYVKLFVRYSVVPFHAHSSFCD